MTSDLLQAGVVIGSAIVGHAITVAVLKTDMRWMKKWQRNHEEQDNLRFESLHQDVRDLRTGRTG